MSKEISVIITAHNRKRYILDAIRSVLANNFPKDKLEIIVVKNYRDDYIDNEIEKLARLHNINIISLIENDTKLGKKIFTGIKNSQSEIITFLEDDDLYLPSRLRTIATVFSKSKDLIFYHNMIKVLGNKRSRKLTFNYLHDKIISCDKDKLKNWRLLNKTEAKFNLSSMAFKKEILHSWIDIISRINLALDNFFFYVALKEKGCMMIDNEPLTEFRATDKRDYVRDENELLDFKKYIALKFYEDFSLFMNVFEDEPFNEDIKGGMLFWFLEYKVLSKEINISVSLKLRNFLIHILKDKSLIALYLSSLLPFKIRKYLIYRYLV